MAAVPTGWYYLDAASTPVGPHNTDGLKDLVRTGVVRPGTLVWREGCEAWTDVAQVADFSQSGADAIDSKGEPPSGVVGDLDDEGDPDAELAAFKAEISALGGDEGNGARKGGGFELPGSPEEKFFEDDDGTLYVWDSRLRKFIAQSTDAPAGTTLALYDESVMTFQGEEEVIPTLAGVLAAEQAALAAEMAAEEEQLKEEKKRKAEEAIARKKAKKAKRPGIAAAPAEGTEAATGTGTGMDTGTGARTGEGGEAAAGSSEAAAPAGWFELKHNTSVYVAGLPDDVTRDEVVALFSKCGLIKEDDSGHPRVKLYKDNATGMLKGDALVTYLKEPSVALAVNLLDGTAFWPGGATPMRVSVAQFQMKGNEYVARAAPKKKKKKKGPSKQERRLGWDGFDDKLPAERVTVVMKHLFTPEELISAEDVALLESDVKGECTKFGRIEKVRVFRHNPEGVVSVRFVTDESADACVEKMHGRFFAGRRVAAALWDGLTNYNIKPKETEEEQQARLEAYARELESAGVS